MDDQARFVLSMRLGDMTRDQLMEECYQKHIALVAAIDCLQRLHSGWKPDTAVNVWRRPATPGGTVIEEMTFDEKWFLLKMDL